MNDKYLDKNYGGIFIVWDRLFGSYIDEDDAEPCVYGTRGPLRSWNPLWANLQYYAELAHDSWHTRAWADKLRVWFMHPGWRPADVAARWPKAAFEIRAVQRFDPPVRRGAAMVAAALFVLLLTATALFLWNAHHWSSAQQLAAGAGIVVGLWGVGALCTPRRGGGRSGAGADPATSR